MDVSVVSVTLDNSVSGIERLEEPQIADTLSAQIAESVTEIVTTTIELIPHKAPLPSLVVRKTIGKGHDRVEIPRVNSTSSVQTPTEGDELVLTSQFDLTSTTIQPTSRVQLVRVSRRATQFSQDDVIALVSEELAQTQSVDMDLDIAAEFTNLTCFSESTAGIGGGTGVNLVLTDLRHARALLKNNARSAGGPAPGRIHVVMGPIQEEDLFADFGATGVSGLTLAGNPAQMSGIPMEIIQQYHIPQNMVWGMTLWADGNLTEDANGDLTVGIFSEKALYLAIAKDWDMETFKVPTWDGVILRAIADYNSGVGAYPKWGGRILVDGA